MGLAGPKKSTRISADPNNTHWSRTTDRFGHKILSSYGWTSGNVLGADPNSPLHTAASASHIKVVLKDDNLGIGCSRNNAADECTGLGDLQSLLGRLNGKSDVEVKKEEDTRKAIFVNGRYGMKFVRGGVYVSSDLGDLVKRMNMGGVGGVGPVKKEYSSDDEVVVKVEELDSGEVKIKVEETVTKRKRKRDEIDHEDKAARRRRKQEKKEKKERSREKKARKEKRRKEKASTSTSDSESTSKSSSKSSKSSSKRDKKRKDKPSKSSKKSKTSSESGFSSEEEDDTTTVTTAVSTPISRSGTSTPVAHATGRHALRAKWIAAKRGSVMDAKALNEILMIKA